MSLFEFKVSRKSPWAKYEGSTTCNARAFYMLMALLGLGAIGLVALTIYGLVVEPAETLVLMFLFGLGAAFFGLIFYEIVTGKDLLKVLSEKRWFMAFCAGVENFFRYGFIWFWWPLMKVADGLDSFFQTRVGRKIERGFRFVSHGIAWSFRTLIGGAWKATIGRLIRFSSRQFDAKERRLLDDETYQARRRARIVRKNENEKIREDFWRAYWRDFLTHTSIPGVLLGSAYLYLKTPGSTTLVAFPFMLFFCCLLGWLVMSGLLAAVVQLALPAWERFCEQHPIKDSVIYHLYEGAVAFGHDLKAHVCRYIVVNDYRAWGLPMRRVFTWDEAKRAFDEESHKLILFGRAVSHCKAGSWQLLVRSTDEETRRILDGQSRVHQDIYFLNNVDGYSVYNVSGQKTFLELYPSIQA